MKGKSYLNRYQMICSRSSIEKSKRTFQYFKSYSFNAEEGKSPNAGSSRRKSSDRNLSYHSKILMLLIRLYIIAQ